MSIDPDGTMFVALHGELAVHPWRDRSTAAADAYSFFVARSSAMGWLTEAKENASGGIWGMNDAGQDTSNQSSPPRVAWFQVSVTAPVPADRPLPVQAFLSCAGDVAARIGALHLQAVQILLPAGAPADRGAVMTLLQDTGWFADSDPHSRTPVRVTIDSGPDPSIRSAAPQIFRWIHQVQQDVFTCESFSVTDEDHLILQPIVSEGLRPGRAQQRATFRGAMAEWSLDALGWLVAFLAAASSRHGVRTPLILAADRAEPSAPVE